MHQFPIRNRTAICALALVAMLVAAVPAWAQNDRSVRVMNDGSGLTLKMIDEAISAGIKGAYTKEPVYTIRDERTYGSNWSRYPYATIHEMGNHSLCAWGMLACGETYQNPTLMRRLHWIFSKDSPFSYDRGMRLQMLAELPYSRWSPWVRRDAVWMEAALTDKGNFPHSYRGGDSKGYGDNANGQYGVLGLWGAERSGMRIDTKIWNDVDAYWRSAQLEDSGAWAIYHPKAEATANADGNRISGPMTAGAVAALSLTERYLYGPKMLSASWDTGAFPHLPKGVEWLDQNFRMDDPREANDWYYYMGCIQRVGHASGYRTFNDIDWFRQVTAALLHRQDASGLWSGQKGELLSTGFSLLYLANAYRPLAIGKIRSDNVVWNTRPHDIWNFADFISHQYEYDTSWQIVELNQPVFSLIESPVLYLSTGSAFTLSEEEINNLRDYTEAGGLLIVNSEAADSYLSIKDLASQLYPTRALEKMPDDHAIKNIHENLGVKVPMEMVQNDIRPLMIVFKRDMGDGLQKNSWSDDAFKALSNIYLYVTGLNPRRPRLQNNYISPQIEAGAPVALSAARIKHGGNYDPEPAAMDQLKNMLLNDHSVDFAVQPLNPSELTDQKIAFLTTTGDARLAPNEATALRQWINSGGLLWIDAAGGTPKATESATKLMTQLIPEAISTPLPPEHPIVSGNGIRGGYDNRRVHWRFYALRTMGPVFTPRLQVVEVNRRPAIIFSAEDVTCGLAGFDHWGIFGYTPESARQLAINSCLMALRNPAPGTGFGGGGGDF